MEETLIYGGNVPMLGLITLKHTQKFFCLNFPKKKINLLKNSSIHPLYIHMYTNLVILLKCF